MTEKFTCKHCKELFDITDKPKNWPANHSRWCDCNPKQKEYKVIARENGLSKNIGIKFQSEVIKKKRSESIKQAHIDGKYDYSTNGRFSGKTHSETTKNIISQKARNSPHRRLKKNMIEYNGILLDSSWEYELAKRLDYLNIVWERPKPIKWFDKDGNVHNYFPDFYLPEFDIFIDPKNPFACEVQKEKIESINETYNNIIILDSLDKCKNFNIDLIGRQNDAKWL